MALPSVEVRVYWGGADERQPVLLWKRVEPIWHPAATCEGDTLAEVERRPLKPGAGAEMRRAGFRHK